MRAFDSPRGLQLPCLARRTQVALLKRPDQVRLLGGAPSKSRSFSSQDACVPCRRQGCKSPPRPQQADGWPRGLWRRFAESLRTLLRWFESSSTCPTLRVGTPVGSPGPAVEGYRVERLAKVRRSRVRVTPCSSVFLRRQHVRVCRRNSTGRAAPFKRPDRGSSPLAGTNHPEMA
jgi:hypothetical protein